ncbi:DUF1698 domain-containing protein [Acuticoccus sp. MNP-M23]|uniref:DUF1698 domain-containing protein n=1 Tax=Acuticoccus sp. MNP-M23 TaxID=3072793 RepID=UPI002815BF71|nr:DUF1698 domain-containing protein [Acuticoccus sp. MNP-M23]WMS44065.1 DUF1698 domain-containing protein [Acuticoccus sp. MNP-M23]
MPDPTPPVAPLTADEKRSRVQAFRWFHSLDLGDGVTTPGVVSAERLAFQSDRVFKHPVDGLSVLDIGCWDGHFAFEAKRRGAARVLGADHFVWDGPGWGDKGAFDLARGLIDPTVEDQVIDIDDMTPETVGEFDVVLFLGILYHLKNPLSVIEQMSRLAGRMIVIETHMDQRLPPEPPAMVFYPFDELNKDPSNWWGPNPAAVIAMLHACGFSKVEADEPYYSGGGSRCLVHGIR